jgi:hypothetical protein
METGVYGDRQFDSRGPVNKICVPGTKEQYQLIAGRVRRQVFQNSSLLTKTRRKTDSNGCVVIYASLSNSVIAHEVKRLNICTSIIIIMLTIHPNPLSGEVYHLDSAIFRTVFAVIAECSHSCLSVHGRTLA